MSRLSDGTVVRGYSLTFLAEGGMSAVYRGEKDGQSYILKAVPADQPPLVLALTQEKGLLERLNHPRIVRFIALFEEGGTYYLVLEFLHGTTLEELAQTKPITEQQAREWGAQLCEALEYLHEQTPPVIYRDLKPSNVMLTGQGCKIIDFGIARVHKGTRSEDTEALGSFFTASPEHFGAAETDARSDVFTLGATLHDLLSGPDFQLALPFQFPPIRTLNPEVSKDLEAVLMKATAFEPEQRYQTMGELREALKRLIPAPASPPPPGPPPPAPRKRSFPVAALVVLVLLAVSLGAWALWPRQAGPAAAVDPGLEGDVFGVRAEKDGAVVTLGEDIGLFKVRDGFGVKARVRAEQLAGRLNNLYHEQCPACGVFKLEPEGFRIARYDDPRSGVDEVALFYSHEDGGHYHAPLLLALLSEQEASRLGATPRYAAGYWRDLTRDLIQISRAQSPRSTALGPELEQELVAARKHMSEHPTVANLNAVLAQIDNAKAKRLRTLFERVPTTFKCGIDVFPPVGNFRPLKG